ncbi:hypothetical protein SAMN05216389_101166 [Oceanobacillus limi]|uniref:Uncharacterized protein n=1 Tax=Oceanobacillus limi TaxID=930131 RepID=A0A1H9Y3D8_9BACI|nr:hypothetical protein [Oceanobacillus limi]SES63314.1 hypothetical protein SAMN05216389_101166 [Oceanobacillus limi]
MLPTFLSIVLIIALIFSISVIIQKRKKAGITGIKSALTSICLCLMAVMNLLAYWFDFMGLLSWSITVVLLILGTYFTKYMPSFER